MSNQLMAHESDSGDPQFARGCSAFRRTQGTLSSGKDVKHVREELTTALSHMLSSWCGILKMAEGGHDMRRGVADI